MKSLLLLALLAALPQPAQAQHAGHASASPYAGQEMRDIKSLSADDIAELLRGGGWGLAKAAELNGVPGPAHLLELKDEIGLDAGQVVAIQTIFEKMRTDAAKEGERLIDSERAIERAFRDGTATQRNLRKMIAEAERSRARLRYIHLATHLRTPPLLTRAQLDRYADLRGYARDPCANVPAGHNADMWRRHNACK